MNNCIIISLLLSTVQLAQIPKGGGLNRIIVKSFPDPNDRPQRYHPDKFTLDIMSFLDEFDRDVTDLWETDIPAVIHDQNKDILAETPKPIGKLPPKALPPLETTQNPKETLQPRESPMVKLPISEKLSEALQPMEKTIVKLQSAEKPIMKLPPTSLPSPSPALKAVAKPKVAAGKNDVQRILDEFENEVTCEKYSLKKIEETSHKPLPTIFPSLETQKPIETLPPTEKPIDTLPPTEKSIVKLQPMEKSIVKLPPTALPSPSPALKAVAKPKVAAGKDDLQWFLDQFEREVACLKSANYVKKDELKKIEETFQKLSPKDLPSLEIQKPIEAPLPMEKLSETLPPTEKPIGNLQPTALPSPSPVLAEVKNTEIANDTDFSVTGNNDNVIVEVDTSSMTFDPFYPRFKSSGNTSTFLYRDLKTSPKFIEEVRNLSKNKKK